MNKYLAVKKLEEISEKWLADLPKDWQKWIWDNLENGCSSHDIAQVLYKNGFRFEQLNSNEKVENDDVFLQELKGEKLKQKILELYLQGIAPEQIQKEINLEQYSLAYIQNYCDEIQNDPLFQTLLNTQHLLNKRNWLLNTLDQLAQLGDGYTNAIQKIETPDFDVFIQQYYSQNRAVIFLNGIQHWAALQKWNPQYFAEHYGDDQIEIQMGREQDQQFERHSVKLKQKMKMRDFVELVEQSDQSNNFYMTANNASSSQTMLNKLYKDIGNFGENYCDLEYQNQLCFLWFGPKGTFTPLHHDLTNNMLVQIYGRKKVTLIPALEVAHLYNDRWVFSEISDPNQVDLKRHPNFSKVKKVECILEAGEALFIPIGWWHSVESLDISISLSFTHFNAINSFSQDFPRAKDE